MLACFEQHVDLLLSWSLDSTEGVDDKSQFESENGISVFALAAFP